MKEFLTDIGVQELVADFIANPEWLHMGTAALLMLLIVGVAYLLRVDIDPYIFGRRQSFNATIERLIFWPVTLMVLISTYYGSWNWPESPVEGFTINKFTLGLGMLLVLILGRALIHFIHTERDRWDFFDNFPFYLMIQFQFFVPLAYYYQLERNGLMPKEQLGFAMACIFILYFLARWLLGRPTHIPRNRIAPFVWLFIAWMLITVIFMPYRLAAVKNVIQWISFAACFLVALAYIPDKRRRDIVLLTVIIAALCSTLWGFWKYFDLPLTIFNQIRDTYPEGHDLAGQPYFYKTPTAGRYFLLAGFFANPNYYGEYLALTLFIALGMLLGTDSRKLRIFLSVALAINSFEMVALYNRAGWLGIFAGAAFVLFGFMWGRLPIFKRVSKPGLIGGVVALAVVLVLTGVIFNSRETDETPLSFTPWERLQSMTDFAGDETLRNRLTMWRASTMMLTDKETFPQRLIFGGGFGFFEVEYLPYQTEILETYNFNDWFHNVIPTFRAHNDHLQMLVEAGITGWSLYTLIFILFFIYGFRYIKDESDPARRFYALGILGATASILATAFFSFPLHKIQHGCLIFTAMGFLIAEMVERKMVWQSESTDVIETEASEQPVTRKKKKKLRKSASVTPEVSKFKSFQAEKGRKRATQASAGIPQSEKVDHDYPDNHYVNCKMKFRPELAIPLVLILLFLCTWGVYTQVINFKSQYYVVKGIAALRNIDGNADAARKVYVGQVAADFFWRAYQLDPTNGRAEFFHGFALIKKNTYVDVVAGTTHLEEGQLLYPQSDTFYALAMGYEARRNLAREREVELRAELEYRGNQIAGLTDEELTIEDLALIEERKIELERLVAELDADAILSNEMAINSYRTAAQYYPVKVEYYKELLRLLEEQERWEEMIFWSERALVVDEWLLKKPPIRWQLYLWLGKSHRALGAIVIENDDIDAGLEHWAAAEAAFIEGVRISSNLYYHHYELAQIYEAYGDIAAGEGNLEEAMSNYSLARDRYVQVFNKKDHVGPSEQPFDYAYYLLGRIYEKLGDNERAISYYRQLLTQSLYSPGTDTYQRTRERIQFITAEWEGSPPPGAIEEVPDEPVEPQ